MLFIYEIFTYNTWVLNALQTDYKPTKEELSWQKTSHHHSTDSKAFFSLVFFFYFKLPFPLKAGTRTILFYHVTCILELVLPRLLLLQILRCQILNLILLIQTRLKSYAFFTESTFCFCFKKRVHRFYYTSRCQL